MKDCSALQQQLRAGPKGVTIGMNNMYLDLDFQRIAKWNHSNCSVVQRLLNWEDFHLESIIRFVDQVLKGKRIRSCKFYFYSICRNYCLELVRSSKEPKVEMKESNVDQLMEAIRPFVAQLSGRCKIILEALYYHSSPLNPKERQALSDLLLKHGYEVKPSSISSVISFCKRKLKEKIEDSGQDFF